MPRKLLVLQVHTVIEYANNLSYNKKRTALISKIKHEANALQKVSVDVDIEEDLP